MRQFVFSRFEVKAPGFDAELALAWGAGDPHLEALASAAVSAWRRLEHAHAQRCAAGEALVEASVAFVESTEAVAEAALALRCQAWFLGEVEYSDEIAADTLPQALSRILRARPPDGLAGLHARLLERERIWREDREAVDSAGVQYREAHRRHSNARRTFEARRAELCAGLRRASPCLRRAG